MICKIISILWNIQINTYLVKCYVYLYNFLKNIIIISTQIIPQLKIITEGLSDIEPSKYLYY